MLSFKQFSEHPKQSFKAWPDPTRKTLFVPCCRGQSVERYGKESFEKSDKKMETKPSEQNPHQNFLRETLALIRAKNSIMVGFAVLVGIAVASHDPTRLVSRVALLGFLTGFTISSFSMISNDIYDIEVDKLNQPDRPLPSGRVSKKQAWAVAFAFLAVGSCCPFNSNTLCLWDSLNRILRYQFDILSCIDFVSCRGRTRSSERHF